MVKSLQKEPYPVPLWAVSKAPDGSQGVALEGVLRGCARHCLMLYIFFFCKDTFPANVLLSIPSPNLPSPVLEKVGVGCREVLLATVSGQMCAHAFLGDICKSGLSPDLSWHGITYLALYKNRTYPPVLYRLTLFNCFRGSTSKGFCKFFSP